MRRVVLLITLALFGLPAAAKAQLSVADWQEPGFDLQECATNATHILVVDSRGRVLEVWKGGSVPGDHIPIERFYLPVLPRLQMASTERRCASPLLETYWRDDLNRTALASERLILFLVKSYREDDTTKFLDGWLPAGRSGWFASSTARVNLCGCVWAQPPPWVWRYGGMSPSVNFGMEEGFKLRVMEGRY